MQCRAEEDERVAGHHLDRDRRARAVVAVAPVAPRPDDRCAILTGVRCERPHDVDQIFGACLAQRPHLLVAVRGLHLGAREKLDRLRQVELDMVAVWSEHGLRNFKDGGMRDERGGFRTTPQKAVKAL